MSNNNPSFSPLLFFLLSFIHSFSPPPITPSPLSIVSPRHLQKNRRDTCNFDKEFTKMATDLTPTDKLVIMNLDQDDFMGFSYTNPEYAAPGN